MQRTSRSHSPYQSGQGCHVRAYWVTLDAGAVEVQDVGVPQPLQHLRLLLELLQNDSPAAAQAALAQHLHGHQAAPPAPQQHLFRSSQYQIRVMACMAILKYFHTPLQPLRLQLPCFYTARFQGVSASLTAGQREHCLRATAPARVSPRLPCSPHTRLGSVVYCTLQAEPTPKSFSRRDSSCSCDNFGVLREACG